MISHGPSKLLQICDPRLDSDSSLFREQGIPPKTPHGFSLSRLGKARLLVHLHRVIPIKRWPCLLQRDTPSTPCKELSPDLRGNLVVPVAQEEIQQSLSLVFGDVVLVPLGKSKHALVEEDGQRPGAGALYLSDHRRVANKVEHKRVHALPCC